MEQPESSNLRNLTPQFLRSLSLKGFFVYHGLFLLHFIKSLVMSLFWYNSGSSNRKCWEWECFEILEMWFGLQSRPLINFHVAYILGWLPAFQICSVLLCNQNERNRNCFVHDTTIQNTTLFRKYLEIDVELYCILLGMDTLKLVRHDDTDIFVVLDQALS